MKHKRILSVTIPVTLLVSAFCFQKNLYTGWARLRARTYVWQLERAGVLHPADIVFHQSRSSQSRAIAAATHSRLTHCGLLDYRHGQWQVLEAVQTVSYTPLWRWIARGVPGTFCIAGLVEPLSPAQQEQVLATGRSFLEKKYDLAFGWSDERIYCSELVYKAYHRGAGKRLAPLTQLGRFDLSHPAVQAKLQERYGSLIPLQEPVISPEAIYQSPSLQILHSNE